MTTGQVARSFPFSGYDFFGYLIPGAALLASLIAVDMLAYPEAEESASVVFGTLLTIARRLPRDGWVVEGLLGIIGAGVSYVLGHFVASIAGVAIDRCLVAKGSGYPSRRFLFPDSTIDDCFTQPFWLALFFWSNVAIVAVYSWILGVFGTKGDLCWAIVICSIPLLLAALSVWARAYSLWLVGQGNSKTSDEWKLVAPCHLKLLEWLASVPRLVAWILAEFAHTQTSFDSQFVAQFEKRFRLRFGLDPQKAGTNLYWFPVLHLKMVAPDLSLTADNWLQLYSFSRNLAASLYVSGMYAAVVVVARYGLPNAASADLASRGLPFVFFVASMAVLFRYYYLYADYYTKFVLRAYYYVETVNTRGHGESESGVSP